MASKPDMTKSNVVLDRFVKQLLAEYQFEATGEVMVSDEDEDENDKSLRKM